MKVGIITFHNAENYGAVLQCYALQEVVKRMGHDVQIIDYRNYFITNIRYKNILNKREIVKRIVTLRLHEAQNVYIHYKNNKQKHNWCRLFQNKFLNLTETCSIKNIPIDFDAYIIGSDQMWTLSCAGGYDPVYFAEFTRGVNSKLIGYAISSNADFVVPLTLPKFREIVNRFDFLSFREEKISDLTYCLTQRKTPVTIDPTLLTTKELWEPLINKKWESRKYVTTYEVRKVHNKPTAIIDKAIEYAKKHHLEVINLTDGGYSIEDFVSIIRYARYVFTSSFHATVFSIIFNTPFTSFLLHDGSDGRYETLLKKLDAQNHLVEIDEDTPIIEKFNNQENLDDKLTILRKQSMDFLEEALQ